MSVVLAGASYWLHVDRSPGSPEHRRAGPRADAGKHRSRSAHHTRHRHRSVKRKARAVAAPVPRVRAVFVRVVTQRRAPVVASPGPARRRVPATPERPLARRPARHAPNAEGVRTRPDDGGDVERELQRLIDEGAPNAPTAPPPAPPPPVPPHAPAPDPPPAPAPPVAPSPPPLPPAPAQPPAPSAEQQQPQQPPATGAPAPPPATPQPEASAPATGSKSPGGPAP
jgi:hypothetical protein